MLGLLWVFGFFFIKIILCARNIFLSVHWLNLVKSESAYWTGIVNFRPLFNTLEAKLVSTGIDLDKIIIWNWFCANNADGLHINILNSTSRLRFDNVALNDRLKRFPQHARFFWFARCLWKLFKFFLLLYLSSFWPSNNLLGLSFTFLIEIIELWLLWDFWLNLFLDIFGQLTFRFGESTLDQIL